MTRQEQVKQEFIKRVYGEYYKECNPDENGWTKWTDPARFSDLEFDNVKDLMRPLSLKGIEDNNGWTKILSREDLPKEYGWYLVVERETGKILEREFYKGNIDFFYIRSSHYKPIQKQKKPIY
jgi:hypothetical protein